MSFLLEHMINNANIGPYLLGNKYTIMKKNNGKTVSRIGNAQCPAVIPSKQQQQKIE